MDFFQCFLVALIFNFLLMFGADFIIKDLEMIENEIHASYQLLLIAMCLGSDGKKIALCLFCLYLKKSKTNFSVGFLAKNDYTGFYFVANVIKLCLQVCLHFWQK